MVFPIQMYTPISTQKKNKNKNKKQKTSLILKVNLLILGMSFLQYCFILLWVDQNSYFLVHRNGTSSWIV